MRKFFEVVEAVKQARQINGDNDYFAVEYYNNQNPTNRFYLVVRDEQDFAHVKDSFKEWDFTFNRLAV